MTQPVDAPSDLARAILRHDHWTVPNAILDALFRPRARVAVKACHASSKTYTAADAVLLSLLLGGDAITTAPTWTQVEQVLWGAIRHGLEDSIFPIAAWGDINRTEIRLPTGEFAIGLSTDQAVRFQGYHARAGAFLLIVMDEAPGVLPGIYEAIEGISAGGDVRQLLIGNPIIASGPFYDLFAGAALGWERFTIDAFATPNLCGLSIEELLELPDHELDEAPRPYLVTRRWVRDRYQEWGPGHPLWASRVRGQFPSQGEDALIALAWIEAAQARWQANSEPDAGEVILGSDIARFGADESVTIVRRGRRVLSVEAWAQLDLMATTGRIARLLREHGASAANVDEVGMGGGPVDRLAELKLPVRGINVAETCVLAADREKYVNQRAQLYQGLADRFREGDIEIPPDRLLAAQLASLRYGFDSRGRLKIESKEEAARRGVKSPDRAEALMLAFASADPRDRLVEAVRGAMAPRDQAAQSERKLPDRAYAQRGGSRRSTLRGVHP